MQRSQEERTLEGCPTSQPGRHPARCFPPSSTLQAAYTPEGAAWLDQLVAYIYDNYRTFRQQLKAALPQLPLARLEGTYLAWLDVRSLLHPAPHPSTLNPSPLTLHQNSPSSLKLLNSLNLKAAIKRGQSLNYQLHLFLTP